jgi:hypothetical protein
MKCKTEVLLMNGSMSVGQCTGCKRVGVHFNNLLAGFSQYEFKLLKREFREREF